MGQMNYTSPTLTFSLDVLNGAEFDLTKAYGKGETERCVETPWAALTFARAQSMRGYVLSGNIGVWEEIRACSAADTSENPLTLRALSTLSPPSL